VNTQVQLSFASRFFTRLQRFVRNLDMGGVCTIAGRDSPSCTDNFQVVPQLVVSGHRFHSAEQAYQASKFPVDSKAFSAVAALSPVGQTDEEFGMDVWQIGNSFPTREDWDSVKVKSMYVANLCKFSQNPSLSADLRATQGKIEAAASTWRWEFFNSMIMMRIRDLLVRQEDLEVELARVGSLDGQAVQRELESYS
jgi:predicted NAD-dependent protein-ADP-ribosyltransferase YbiA (DUF1768 family)